MDIPPSGPSGTDSPPLRQTILGSFLRGRRHSNSHLNPPLSPTGEFSNPLALPSGGSPQLPPISTAPSSSGAFSGILRRRRSAGALNGNAPPGGSTPPPVPATTPAAQTAPGLPSVPRTPGGAPAISQSATAHPAIGGGGGGAAAGGAAPGAQAHRIRLVPHLESRRSLRFDAISRDVREGDVPLRIGRFTDRSGGGASAANALGSNKLAFKSKVVSRTHAEIWVEPSTGKFMIRDTKSSSGTFLNHIRLSPANTESRPHELRDGDILQLGVDYQGGTEDIYKCVKIRVEVGREWQAQANAFNTNALKQLKALATDLSKSKEALDHGKKVSTKTGLPDCCICLFSVTIQQALFIAPCSHAFHFKCLRPLLDNHYPAFICPLCRTFADLEADVEVDDADDGWEDSGDMLRVDAIAAGAETETEADNSVVRPGAAASAAMRRNVSAPAGAAGRHVTEMSRLHEEDEDGHERTDEEMGDDADGDAERAAMFHIANGLNAPSSLPPTQPPFADDDGAAGFVAAMEAMDVDHGAGGRALSASPSPAYPRVSPGIGGAGPSVFASGIDSAGSSEGEGHIEDMHGTLGGKRKR